MENPLKCPLCHVEVRQTDYFCYNCGNNLKPKPPDTSLSSQVIVYLKSIFLPPYGLILGIRYFREKDNKSKAIGAVAIVLTILSLVYFTKFALDLLNNINNNLYSQLQQMNSY